jgi:hypothetical protein
MGYLSNLYNSAKKGVASGLGSLGGVFNRIGSSGIISKIGGYVSAASPYVSKGLEMAGQAFGQPELGALGVAAGYGMDYLGKNMTSAQDTSMKNIGANLNTFANNFREPD